MSKTITKLNAMREETITQQGVLFAQIIADSKNPDLTGSLLVRITNSAVRYDELTRHLSEAIEKKTRIPAWLRGFIR